MFKKNSIYRAYIALYYSILYRCPYILICIVSPHSFQYTPPNCVCWQTHTYWIDTLYVCYLCFSLAMHTKNCMTASPPPPTHTHNHPIPLPQAPGVKWLNVLRTLGKRGSSSVPWADIICPASLQSGVYIHLHHLPSIYSPLLLSSVYLPPSLSRRGASTQSEPSQDVSPKSTCNFSSV